MKDISPISRAKSLKEQAYDLLKELILTGKLEQGKLHNEKRLAEVFGVSRTPVREALLELSREGMVIFEPGRGVKVRKITPSQVREVFEVRRLIEGYIIQTIMDRLTPPDLIRLGKIVLKQERFAERDDRHSFIVTDRDFHLFLASRGGNHQIQSILVNLQDQIHLMGIQAIKHHSRMQQVIQEHRRILSALKQKNGSKSHQEMMTHLNNTEKILISNFKKEETGKGAEE